MSNLKLSEEERKYIKYIIINTRLNYFKKEKRKTKEISIDFDEIKNPELIKTIFINSKNESEKEQKCKFKDFKYSFTNSTIYNLYQSFSLIEQYIIYLFYELCFKDKEIGAILNININTVKTIRSRILKKIKKQIK